MRHFRRKRASRSNGSFVVRQALRLEVFERDDCTCHYCKQRFERGSLTVDHIVPRSRGGRTVLSNLITACEPCNRKKGSTMPSRQERKEFDVKTLAPRLRELWDQAR